MKRSCVVIHNTLKFIESFKVISLFSYQGSLFCCRSRRQLVYYILSSLFCQELFFIFLKSFLSIGFVRSVISNATTLISCHVLFCLSITFFIFQKINNQVSFSRPSKSACLSQWTFILPSLSGYVNTFFLSIKNS